MIDFTKPIRYKSGNNAIIKILFHDEVSVYYEVEFSNDDKGRIECSAKYFNETFENVPEPKRQIKGFVAFYTRYDTYTPIFKTKAALLKHIEDNKGVKKFLHTIVEINTYEGEGL